MHTSKSNKGIHMPPKNTNGGTQQGGTRKGIHSNGIPVKGKQGDTSNLTHMGYTYHPRGYTSKLRGYTYT